MRVELSSKNVLSLSVIFIVFTLVAISPLPWNEAVEDAIIDMLFHLRGSREVSDEIVFVYLGEENIQAIGAWPITRDYYGYMTHVLTQRGARVIGFYGLFEYPSRTYPEFDRRLADFFKSSGVVCLPATFTELVEDGSRPLKKPSLPEEIAFGENAILPIPQFKESAAGIGFSNPGNEAVIRNVPLVISSQDSIMLSFGAELARIYLEPSSPPKITPKRLVLKSHTGKDVVIPIDKKGRIRLNHFGSSQHIRSMDFLDLLQTFESSPDSLDFSGKLVVVDAASPSIPLVKATPLAEVLPASLIHATVAENIIFQNFLEEIPKWIQVFIILLMIVSAFLVLKITPKKIAAGVVPGFILLYVSGAVLLFSIPGYLPPVFYPVLAYLVTIFYLGLTESREFRMQSISAGRFLEEHIKQKQVQLEEAEAKLLELKSQLLTELEEKKVLSEESQRLAEEKRSLVMTLEKQLRDLSVYSVPQEQSVRTQYREIVHAHDSKMVSVLELIDKIGSDDIPVLIQGETGTGKELIARAIHRMSERSKSPFVAINCGALPETLLESELFGHEKGSFTGAHSRRRGRFELADGGTMFLDEITETTPAFQARLLRVLQDGSFERLGGEQTLTADVRIIAATNKDLKAEVERGIFREDLYYRLQGFTLTVPPLRERPTDVPLLATHFLEKHGYQKVSSLSDRACEQMQTYRWPGNVRELENVIRRAAILAQSEGRDMIQQVDLPQEIRESESPPFEQGIYQPLDEQILSLLRAYKFSRSAISQTARALDNRDRGTITEYFRGLCFEALVNNDFDLEQSAREIAGTNEGQVIERVKTKIKGYLDNLKPFSGSPDLSSMDSDRLPSCYKGLPKKYHPLLDRIIENLPNIH